MAVGRRCPGPQRRVASVGARWRLVAGTLLVGAICWRLVTTPYCFLASRTLHGRTPRAFLRAAGEVVPETSTLAAAPVEVEQAPVGELPLQQLWPEGDDPSLETEASAEADPPAVEEEAEDSGASGGIVDLIQSVLNGTERADSANALVEEVKAVQRQPKGGMAWHIWCMRRKVGNARLLRDPARHTTSSLQKFLDALARGDFKEDVEELTEVLQQVAEAQQTKEGIAAWHEWLQANKLKKGSSASDLLPKSLKSFLQFVSLKFGNNMLGKSTKFSDDSLAVRVEALRKASPAAKEQWHYFHQEYGTGSPDPHEHVDEDLERFLALFGDGWRLTQTSTALRALLDASPGLRGAWRAYIGTAEDEPTRDPFEEEERLGEFLEGLVVSKAQGRTSPVVHQ
mmetsp:Transcript_18671/g.52131  ORF Transcript_18671/g.52131 Transcript_18671/m.52131 type:complete len:398 (+) Transcript_18671:69-1262(+)